MKTASIKLKKVLPFKTIINTINKALHIAFMKGFLINSILLFLPPINKSKTI